MSWIIVGFGIGIGLVLAYLALCLCLIFWQWLLGIVAGLFLLVLIFIAQGDDRFAHSVSNGLGAFFTISGILLAILLIRDPPQWLRSATGWTGPKESQLTPTKSG
jgi:hypothetical protein